MYEAIGTGELYPIHVSFLRISSRSIAQHIQHIYTLCLQVVCNSCSMERRYLTYQQKEGRVCDECIEGVCLNSVDII